MKLRKLFFLFLLACAINAKSQMGPTNNNPALPALNGTNAGNFWSRAGNTLLGGTNNIFGTFFASPIYTYTDGLFRTRLNGTSTYTVVPGLPATTHNGFLFLTANPSAAVGGNSFSGAANYGAFSLLHLNGEDANIQNFGFRNWMRTGITFTENFDGA